LLSGFFIFVFLRFTVKGTVLQKCLILPKVVAVCCMVQIRETGDIGSPPSPVGKIVAFILSILKKFKQLANLSFDQN
jgi:hypothetical protein